MTPWQAPLASRHQRGAAILTAMLTVVLVATLASSMMWQQWRGIEVESAQRTRVQSAWILTGALDWARLILREDARSGGADNLTEPWAVPLAPARLSTFLAAENGQSLVTDETDAGSEAFLSGQIQDLQARLNLANLLKGGKLDDAAVAAWARLFTYLNLPQAELDALLEGLLRSQLKAADIKPGESWPLPPQAVTDLRWLGLSENTLKILQPFITVLPVSTPVNLNTAAPEVLLAILPGLDIAQARAMVNSIASQPLKSSAEATEFIKKYTGISTGGEGYGYDVKSSYFSVTGQLQLGATTVQEVSVLQRDGLDVKILSRTRQIVTGALSTLQ